MEKILSIQNKLKKSTIVSDNLYNSLYTLNKLLNQKIESQHYIETFNERFEDESNRMIKISDELINLLLDL